MTPKPPPGAQCLLLRTLRLRPTYNDYVLDAEHVSELMRLGIGSGHTLGLPSRPNPFLRKRNLKRMSDEERIQELVKRRR